MAGETPVLVVRLVEQLYGIPVASVREILRMPQVTHVPRRSEYLRGLVNLRGTVLPLLDLRVMLGLPTLRKDLDGLRTTLVQREKDHRNWLTELESSVLETRTFRLGTDPHQCAFGRWYDQYMRQDMPLSLRMVLAKFDSPHQAIHALGIRVGDVVRSGETRRALDLIRADEATHLSALLRLFSEVDHLLQDWNDEVAVVVDAPGRRIAVAVDGVDGIDRIAFHELDGRASDGLASTLVDGVGSHSQGGRLVSLLTLDTMFREAVPH